MPWLFLTKRFELLLVDRVSVEGEHNCVSHNEQDDYCAKHSVGAYFVEHKVNLVVQSTLWKLLMLISTLLVIQFDFIVKNVVDLVVF